MTYHAFFHAQDGVAFKRETDGSVRVMVSDGNPGPVIADTTMNPATWASVLAAVCERGENGETWQEARRYHGDPDVVREDALGAWRVREQDARNDESPAEARPSSA